MLIGVCVPLFNVAAVWPMVRHAQRGFLSELVRNRGDVRETVLARSGSFEKLVWQGAADKATFALAVESPTRDTASGKLGRRQGERAYRS